jgi:hypothetical protein
VVPSAEEIARVPAENLHVSRTEFGAVWTAAEGQADKDESSWYLAGVCLTCRWVARMLIPPSTMPGHPAFAPVTGTMHAAYAELVEAECLAAELLLTRRPVPGWLQEKPGWAEGVEATFAWMWRRTGPPPVAVERSVSDSAL